ncbi:MAG TPA: hypothetical protein GX524_05330 [Firmicutes bacterium]|nr:hypothetical protein [Bacillota bacterium]
MTWDIGTLTAAIFTIATLSSVFIKNNPAFEVVQPIFLGVAAGHAFVVNVGIIRSSGWQAIMQGDLWAVIPLVLGILVLTRLIPRLSGMSRVSMAIIGATGATLGLRGALQAQILDQIGATLEPLNSLDNILLFGGVFSTLAYFLFSSEMTKPFRQNQVLKYVPEIGKVVMMVAFGASFGNATMGRLSLLIGRMSFLLKDWIGL